MQRALLVAIAALALGSNVQAEVKSKTIEYEHDGQTLKGYLAWDDRFEGKRPGVLIVHEWWGLDDYTRDRARMLAEAGYVAFALDMYGEGKTTEHPSQAGEWAGQIRQNVGRWRARAAKSLQVLKEQDNVDNDRVAAIGYCFGGATVMQMAYNGEDLRGVASFHGSLPVASSEDAKNVAARVLVCHGAEDHFIPKETIDKFKAALTEANVDWTMVYYANAKHSFTNPESDERGVDGLAYDEKADKRSWKHLMTFFDEIFE